MTTLTLTASPAPAVTERPHRHCLDKAAPWVCSGRVARQNLRHAEARRCLPRTRWYRPLHRIRPDRRALAALSARAVLERARHQTNLCTNVEAAIRHVFGAHAAAALDVAWCESRHYIYARNGQYLGLFQMGSYARARYGHSWTALGQARAAFGYFVASGRDWSPWQCRPWGLAW